MAATLGAAHMSISASCILSLAVSRLRRACLKAPSRSGKHQLIIMSALKTFPAERRDRAAVEG